MYVKDFNNNTKYLNEDFMCANKYQYKLRITRNVDYIKRRKLCLKYLSLFMLWSSLFLFFFFVGNISASKPFNSIFSIFLMHNISSLIINNYLLCFFFGRNLFIMFWIAAYALYCNDEIECNPENCPLPLTVVCTGDNMCMCLEPLQFFEQP